ncbi:hypothetical protein JOD57_003979 [Geodermatophilus bullaregiensis]|uniref:hypothetical protein n=1 Tax=Geodermatophilus bullaregiensis TaxID=1564160 RepID=UPI00195DA4CF|nr:hypothetical protein [Geodermatophilus bullaregiensis]MBM7808142.1 hypothetical protein [Geodermatophilus bullaregiensis]
MRTRTAGRALTVLLATAALGATAGAAAAAPPEGVGPYTASRAWAVFSDTGEELFAEVTVEEVRGSGTSLRLGLFGPAWSCTVDGEDATVAEVEQLESARVVASYDYTCTERDAPQGLAPRVESGTATVDVTWTGVGRSQREPLYDCTVGRYLTRQATVSGGVSLSDGPQSDLDLLNGGGLSHDHNVCPPGWVQDAGA